MQLGRDKTVSQIISRLKAVKRLVNAMETMLDTTGPQDNNINNLEK